MPQTNIETEKTYLVKGSRGYGLIAGKVVIGAAGAITSQATDTVRNVVTFTYSTTGTYTIAGLPSCAFGMLDFSLVSSTITGYYISAQDETAGTATVKFVVGSTVTNPASGDVIKFIYTARHAKIG